MSGAVRSRTSSLGLALLNFAFPNWGDDANKNMQVIDAAFDAFGIAISGPWQNSTAYALASLVVDTDTNELFKVLVAHTSAASGTFLADRVANPTYWIAFSAGTTGAGQWTTATTYFKNDVVYLGYVWAIASGQFVSSASLTTDISNGDFIVITNLTETMDTIAASEIAVEADRVAVSADAASADADAASADADAAAALASQIAALNSANNAAASAASALASKDAAAISETNSGNSAASAAASAVLAATFVPANFVSKVSGQFTSGLIIDDVQFANSVAPTKRARVDVGLVTAGQNRVFYMPDRDVYPGAEELIGDVRNLSGLTFVDWTDLSAYVDIKLHAAITFATSGLLYCRYSSDNGVSFGSGATEYNFAVKTTESTISASATLSSFNAYIFSDVTLAANLAKFDAEFPRFNKSLIMGVETSGFGFNNSTGFMRHISTFGYHNSTTARNALRFYTTSSFASGYAFITGVRG